MRKRLPCEFVSSVSLLPVPSANFCGAVNRTARRRNGHEPAEPATGLLRRARLTVGTRGSPIHAAQFLMVSSD